MPFFSRVYKETMAAVIKPLSFLGNKWLVRACISPTPCSMFHVEQSFTGSRKKNGRTEKPPCRNGG